MTDIAKPVAIFSCIQICAAFLWYLGGHLGTRLVARLYGEQFAPPGLTQLCARTGLWSLIVPIIWAIGILIRSERDAPDLEILAWFAFAVVFALFVGGGGILAAVVPLVTC